MVLNIGLVWTLYKWRLHRRPIADAINKAIEEKLADQRSVVASFGPTIKDNEGHRQAAERLDAITKQKVQLDRLLQLAPDMAFYDALENSVSDANCLNDDERAELRTSIADEMADLREWVTSHRLRRPEHWFSGDKNE